MTDLIFSSRHVCAHMHTPTNTRTHTRVCSLFFGSFLCLNIHRETNEEQDKTMVQVIHGHDRTAEKQDFDMRDTKKLI